MILNQDIFNTLIEFDKLLEQGFEGKDLIISLTEYFEILCCVKNPKSIEIIKCEGELKTKLEDLSKENYYRKHFNLLRYFKRMSKTILK